MLVLNMQVGDDVFFGEWGAPLDRFKQIVVKGMDEGFVTVHTPDEEIDIPFNSGKVDLGLHKASIAAERDEVSGGVKLGIEAPKSIRILRGRIYRRELD